MKNFIRGICLSVLWGGATLTYAVEAHYNVGLELKPLPIFMTTLTGGQGIGGAVELTSSRYDTWVLVTSAEAFRGPRQDEGMIPERIEENGTAPVSETDYIYQQLGVGLRSYSNRQDDSYYIGGEFALTTEVQSFEVADSSYNIVSRSYRPNIEFGYRWVWDNGTVFRLGTKITYVTNIRNQFDGEESELPEEWRDDLLQSLEQASQKDDVYPGIDIGVGYSF